MNILWLVVLPQEANGKHSGYDIMFFLLTVWDTSYGMMPKCRNTFSVAKYHPESGPLSLTCSIITMLGTLLTIGT